MGKITTNRVDFSAISPGEYPESGYFIVGLDTADDKLKKMDSTGTVTVIGDSKYATYPDFVSFPGTGVEGIIYKDLDTDYEYKWDTGTSSYLLTTKLATITQFYTESLYAPGIVKDFSGVQSIVPGYDYGTALTFSISEESAKGFRFPDLTVLQGGVSIGGYGGWEELSMPRLKTINANGQYGIQFDIEDVSKVSPIKTGNPDFDTFKTLEEFTLSDYSSIYFSIETPDIRKKITVDTISNVSFTLTAKEYDGTTLTTANVSVDSGTFNTKGKIATEIANQLISAGFNVDNFGNEEYDYLYVSLAQQYFMGYRIPLRDLEFTSPINITVQTVCKPFEKMDLSGLKYIKGYASEDTDTASLYMNIELSYYKNIDVSSLELVDLNYNQTSAYGLDSGTLGVYISAGFYNGLTFGNNCVVKAGSVSITVNSNNNDADIANLNNDVFMGIKEINTGTNGTIDFTFRSRFSETIDMSQFEGVYTYKDTKTISVDFEIYENNTLTTFDLSNLAKIDGSINFNVHDNDVLTSFELPALNDTQDGGIQMSNNPLLTSVSIVNGFKLSSIDIQTTPLDQTSVDLLLSVADDGGINGGTCNLPTPCAIPTDGASNANYLSLIGKSWVFPVVPGN